MKSSAKALFERNGYSKQRMTPSTRRHYERYGISREEEVEWILETYERKKQDCIHLNDSYPLMELSYLIRAGALYEQANDLLHIADQNRKGRTSFGLLNLYEPAYAVCVSPQLSSDEIQPFQEKVLEKLQELFDNVFQGKQRTKVSYDIDLKELRKEELYVLRRLSSMIHTLKEKEKNDGIT